MTKKRKTTKKTQAKKARAVVEDAVPEPKSDPDPEPEPRTEPDPAKKSGAAVGWFAMLLSVVTLAALGFFIIEDRREERSADQSASSLAELRNRVASSNESLSNLDRGLADLAEADEKAASELLSLQQGLENRIELLDSVPSRLRKLENAMATLQGVSSGARDTWLLAEAEYYMQIANAQLQLAGNPHLAALALGMADERIVQLADPALTGVRRALSDELAALEVMDKPDIEGVTLMLASLARVVDSLPLRQLAQAESGDDVDADLSGVDRAWASVKGAVSGLIRVTGPDEYAVPLMTPEATYFLRTNLTLQLQAARLALLRGEQAIFEQSLDDAAAWIELYFDTGSAQVAGALETIGEIRGDITTAAAPEISGSLRLLRQFKTLAVPVQ
jgi:uroporphyrin-3 C-methyltransferase